MFYSVVNEVNVVDATMVAGPAFSAVKTQFSSVDISSSRVTTTAKYSTRLCATNDVQLVEYSYACPLYFKTNVHSSDFKTFAELLTSTWADMADYTGMAVNVTVATIEYVVDSEQ